MTSIRAWSLGAGIAVAAACTWAFATGRHADPAGSIERRPAAAAPVSTSSSARAIMNPPQFTGVVLARLGADISPRFEGRLRDVTVRLGDRLAEGATIATLEAPAIESALHVAEASLRAAEIDHDRAAVELAEAAERLERRRRLSDKELVSREEIAEADYKHKLALARVDASRALAAERRAEVDKLRRDAVDAVIRAPFAGLVAARYVDPGASVSPSTPIVRLIRADDPFVRFAVTEEWAARIEIGMAVTARTGGDRTISLEGAIDRISPEVDAASRMVFIEARLKNVEPGAPVLSGTLARVSVHAVHGME